MSVYYIARRTANRKTPGAGVFSRKIHTRGYFKGRGGIFNKKNGIMQHVLFPFRPYLGGGGNSREGDYEDETCCKLPLEAEREDFLTLLRQLNQTLV